MSRGSRASLGGLARMGIGAIAGAAATFVMDAVTDVLYTKHIRERESEISSRSASVAIALKLLQALDLHPTKKDAEKVAPFLHWSIGVGSGVIAGLLAGSRSGSIAPAATLTAGGMFCFDEFGIAALGAAPPSSQYPWQTNFRSAVGHATYAFALALAYAALTELARSE